MKRINQMLEKYAGNSFEELRKKDNKQCQQK